MLRACSPSSVVIVCGVLSGHLAFAQPTGSERTAEAARALLSSQERERHAAVVRLGEHGPAAVSALPALTEALREDPSPRVRAAAAKAVSRIAVDSELGIRSLVWALGDSCVEVRVAAELALLSSREHALPELARSLEESRGATQTQGVCSALGRLGPAAVPPLSTRCAVRTGARSLPSPARWGRLDPPPGTLFRHSPGNYLTRDTTSVAEPPTPWRASAPVLHQPSQLWFDCSKRQTTAHA